MLADLAELTPDPGKALQLYAEAALAYGEPAKKMRVFNNMAVLHASLGDNAAALNNALILLALRRENKWPIPAELEQMLQAPGCIPDDLPAAAVLFKKMKPALQELLKHKEINTDKKPITRLNGTIDHFISAGDAGFIKPGKGTNKIYFLFKNFQGNRADIKPGLPVSYEANISFDKKKNRNSEIAVRIRAKTSTQ